MSLIINNGLCEKTIYITSDKLQSEVYFPLKNSAIVNVEPYDVNKVSDMIRLYYDKANFVIDIRLEYLILILDKIFKDYVTVFNIYDTTIISITTFLSGSTLFNVPVFKIYTSTREKLVDMYLTIKFVSKNVNWNVTNALNNIEKQSLLEILMNYIGFSDIERLNVTEKAERFRTLVHNDFRNNDQDIQIFDNKNELANALLILRDNNDHLKVY